MALLDKMVDDEASIITILLGQDIDEKLSKKVAELLTDRFPDLDIDIRHGNQPVYSFLVGIE